MSYLVIWWVVLFAVLPWGVKVPDKQEKGHATSAPERPMVWRKAGITTLVAAVAWLGLFVIIESNLIEVRP